MTEIFASCESAGNVRANAEWLRRLVLCSVLPVAFWTAADAQSPRTVALSGQLAPVVAGGVIFARFGVPAIDGNGRAAFLADLSGSGARGDSDGGVFSEASGTLATVARQGEQAVGLADGIVFDRFSLFNYSATGRTAFHASLAGLGVTDDNNTGLWAEASLGLIPSARAGDRVPGAASNLEYAAFFTRPAINDSEQIAFYPELLETSTGRFTSGLLTSASGELTLAAKAGDSAPDTAAGTVFLEQGFENPFSSRTVIDSDGRTILHGFVDGPNVGEAPNTGLWTQDSHGDLELLARNGDHAPGTSPPVEFLSFAQLPRINAAGQVAFAAFLTRADDDDTLFDVGIWHGFANDLALAARTNRPAPVAGDSAIRFGDLALPNINDRGDVSFQAVLTGDTVTSLDELSLWVQPFAQDLNLRLVARAGDHAPGTAADVRFRAFSTHVLNAAGHLAFMAVVGGPGVAAYAGNSQGIWAEDAAGKLRLIAREGDTLEVAPGDVRTITSLSFQSNTGNSDGQPSGFNDEGMLAFGASFADGTSGVFVSSLASVPEPQLGLWATLFGAYVGVRWGRASRTKSR